MFFKQRKLSDDLAQDLDNARRGDLDNARQLQQCLAAQTMYANRIAYLEAQLAAARDREHQEWQRLQGCRKPVPPARPGRAAPEPDSFRTYVSADRAHHQPHAAGGSGISSSAGFAGGSGGSDRDRFTDRVPAHSADTSHTADTDPAMLNPVPMPRP